MSNKKLLLGLGALGLVLFLAIAGVVLLLLTRNNLSNEDLLRKAAFYLTENYDQAEGTIEMTSETDIKGEMTIPELASSPLYSAYSVIPLDNESSTTYTLNTEDDKVETENESSSVNNYDDLESQFRIYSKETIDFLLANADYTVESKDGKRIFTFTGGKEVIEYIYSAQEEELLSSLNLDDTSSINFDITEYPSSTTLVFIVNEETKLLEKFETDFTGTLKMEVTGIDTKGTPFESISETISYVISLKDNSASDSFSYTK